jgi:hypothetical protein
MSVTIFGILNIGFALFGFVSLLIGRLMLHANLPGNNVIKTLQSDPSYVLWTDVSTVVGLVFAVVLLATGVGLLLSQGWARVISLAYAVIDIIFLLPSSVINYHFMQGMTGQVPGASASMMAVFTLVGALFGLLFGLAYPVLLLIFMTRPKVIAAFGPEPPATSVSG